MKQSLCRIVENVPLWSNTAVLRIDAPALARSMQAGQFALVRDPNTFDPYLRRTAWLYRIENERVTLVAPADDVLMRRLRAGDLIDVLAPLGNAVAFDTNIKHVLLVGQDEYIAQLISIAETALEQKREVVLVHHTSVPNKIFPAHLLSPEIEYHTDEPTTELIAWADTLMLSGSEEFYQTIAEKVHAARYRLESGFARVLIDIPMPCGTGECWACAIDARHGVERACVDGPWFDLLELESRRVR